MRQSLSCLITLPLQLLTTWSWSWSWSMSVKTKKHVCGSQLSSISDDEALIIWASKHFIDVIDVGYNCTRYECMSV